MIEMISKFASVPAITALAMIVATLYREVVSEKHHKYIPLICAMLGMAFGLIVYFTIPQYLEVGNWFDALVVGVVSGFAGTGINQAFRQLKN